MKIYLASGNAHKVQEFQAIADRARAEGGAAVEFVSAKAVGGMPEVVEDTGTFAGNARKKAAALRAKLLAAYPEGGDSVWVLADDSGICVDALGGGPGVESAYFAGPAGDPAANLRKLVDVMRAVPAGKTESRRAAGAPCDGMEPTGTSAPPGRGAHFVCVLVLLGPGGVEQVVEERVYGTLLVEPRGGQGFGYDPLFVPEGFDRSYAELTEEEKNAISHRARAAGRLMAWVKEVGSVTGEG